MVGISFPKPEYVTTQAVDATAVTPSDTTLLVKARGLYVGGAGTVTVVSADAYRENQIKGTAIVPVAFVGVPAGSTIDLHVAKVMATGTTATNIVAFY